eukprot:TRINITY_DN582_c0_g1_i3.p1 TRINITY_DN582_c0_g1~~TRINITY_DN582_c0_g1_i3.p1  ORF type:complete len:165 (-),score=42.31 TRINITY_DN582_c0_g1_i3:240-734(-)
MEKEVEMSSEQQLNLSLSMGVTVPISLPRKKSTSSTAAPPVGPRKLSVTPRGGTGKLIYSGWLQLQFNERRLSESNQGNSEKEFQRHFFGLYENGLLIGYDCPLNLALHQHQTFELNLDLVKKLKKMETVLELTLSNDTYVLVCPDSKEATEWSGHLAELLPST